MEIKRKIEIFTATNRRFVVRRNKPAHDIACVSCGTTMVTAEQAAEIFGISQRSVFQFVETGRVHFTELTEGGAAMICITSFADVFSEPVQERLDINNLLGEPKRQNGGLIGDQELTREI
ncbi:MAG TPA: hypothetical protein PLL77_03850 [Pyrinomonadaceae bacterium]|nr:hypothetical protein [Pyrinomonadaceae bacterium]